jgi:hypothetical protein
MKESYGVRFLEYDGWPGARCIFTTRIGGVSASPYNTFNLSTRVGDDPDCIEENMERLQRCCAIDTRRIRMTEQIHSSIVNTIRSGELGLVGDALISTAKGIWLSVSVADCLPIYIFDPSTPAVGIVHAGWKGTLAKIASSCVKQMTEEFGSDPSRMDALFGPGIGPCCFEVSTDVALRFENVLPGSSSEGYVDLFKANRLVLEDLGVSCLAQKVACTSCLEDLFFSHRRDQGVTGRMLALIAISPE